MSKKEETGFFSFSQNIGSKLNYWFIYSDTVNSAFTVALHGFQQDSFLAVAETP